MQKSLAVVQKVGLLFEVVNVFFFLTFTIKVETFMETYVAYKHSTMLVELI